MAEPEFPVLAVVPDGAVYADVATLLRTLVEERRVDLVALSDADEALALARTPLRLAGSLPDWLRRSRRSSPPSCSAMGRDTETPRGLSKATRTW